MRILYTDAALVVCIKPAGALSTDEPGGVPELVRAELGDAAAEVRTVHRLDRVVSGLMVLARTPVRARRVGAEPPDTRGRLRQGVSRRRPRRNARARGA